MPHSKLHRALLILTLASCSGCRNYSDAISDQFDASGKESIDLAKAVPLGWDKVCVIGPYMGNEQAREALGFDWPAEALTSIEESDGISLLLFVRDGSVIEYVEHPRYKGDFFELDGRCFDPPAAKFRRRKNLPDNWPQLVPESEA